LNTTETIDINGWTLQSVFYDQIHVSIPEYKRDMITWPGAFQHFTHSLLMSNSLEAHEQNRKKLKAIDINETLLLDSRIKMVLELDKMPEFDYKPSWKYLSGEHSGKLIKLQSQQFIDPTDNMWESISDHIKNLHHVLYGNPNIIPGKYTLNPLHIPYTVFTNQPNLDYEIVLITPDELVNRHVTKVLSQIKNHIMHGGGLRDFSAPFRTNGSSVFNYAADTYLDPYVRNTPGSILSRFPGTKIIRQFSWESLFIRVDLDEWEELYDIFTLKYNFENIKSNFENIIKSYVEENVRLVEMMSTHVNLNSDILTNLKKYL
jgi:hypothetical protein